MSEPPSTSVKDATRSRKPHRKSRRGCKRCKARRVKCDEIRPVCGNCRGKGDLCEYPDTPRFSNAHPMARVEIPRLRQHDRLGNASRRTPSPPPAERQIQSVSPGGASIGSSQSYDLIFPIPVGTPVDRLLGLRLFNHYHQMASQTKHAQNVWSTWIADLAVRTPSLMDAILGFSAFHLRHLNANDGAVLAASHEYMSRAIRSHSQELHKGINENNAGAMIATCALILFHASVNQSFLHDTEAGYKLPVHWFRPFKGAGEFFWRVSPWIRDTSIGKLLGSLLITWQPNPQNETPGKFDFLLDDLDAEGLDGDIISAYKLAVIHLSHIYASPHYLRVLQFPALVSPRLIELLETKDPRTLAIVGYFFMLLKIASPIWWIQGAPEREFRAIMAFLPQEWWFMMKWAIQEFEWNGGNLRLERQVDKTESRNLPLSSLRLDSTL